MLQKTPISRLFWVRRRTTWTQRKSNRLSTTLISPAGAATLIYCAGMITEPSSRAKPRQRLIIAQLALRQADDGLQIKIDAIFLQAGADGFQQIAFAHAGDIGAGRALTAAGLHHVLRSDLILRGAGAVRDPAGEFAHQAFQHLELGDDLLALRRRCGPRAAW